jgi:hypothetical protein
MDVTGAIPILFSQVSTYVGTFHKSASLGGNKLHNNSLYTQRSSK